MPIVEIYTARFCPYCRAAKELLKSAGVPYEEISIAANWERRDEMIKRANGQVTLPQVFCGGVHIGGNKELESWVALGKLQELVFGGTPR
jgi:glutaredoxin 3